MIHLSRRTWLLSLPSLALAAWVSQQAVGQEVATLQQTLRAGLKCRRPEEFDYIDTVAALVENGKLPRDLTLSIFDYARRKRPKFPYPWFRQAMDIKAAELGVTIST